MRNGKNKAAPPVTVPQRCAELMKEHGTLRATAKVLGISFTYFWRLKQGDATNPSDETLQKLGLKRSATTFTRSTKP